MSRGYSGEQPPLPLKGRGSGGIPAGHADAYPIISEALRGTVNSGAGGLRLTVRFVIILLDSCSKIPDFTYRPRF